MAARQGLREAEYELAFFTESARTYWKMWGPLGEGHFVTSISGQRCNVITSDGCGKDEGIVELRRRLIYIPDAEVLRRRGDENGHRGDRG
jgi:hypothetical protein